MSVPEQDTYLGRIRELTRTYLAGGPDCFGAFADLVGLLLRLTVQLGTGGIVLVPGPRPRDRMIVYGAVGDEASLVPLTNGAFLRLHIVLFRERRGDDFRLKVEQAVYQYQLDALGSRWVFRYDYLRQPPDPHPASHLQIRGKLFEAEAGVYRGMLERTHFPTGRVSIEAVIRLLIEQFGVPANKPQDFWRRVLAESEAEFERIAYRPLSGPSR